MTDRDIESPGTDELEALRARVAQLEQREAMLEREAAALKGGEQRYRNVYNTAPLAFVCWDTQCRVTDWNKRAEEIFGWTAEEVLGRVFMDFLIAEHARPQVEEVVRGLLRGQLPSRSVNENLTKDGTVITCEWNNAIEWDDNGHVVGVISLALDVTDRRKGQHELARYRDKLEELVDERTRELKEAEEELIRRERFAALGRLTEVVAHELRHPLTIIRGSLFLIGKQLGDQALGDTRTTDRIERSIDRCDRIIEDLLAYARTTDPNLKLTDVDRWVAALLDEQAMPEAVTLVRQLRSMAKIKLDRDHVGRCVVNVLGNAYQAIVDQKDDPKDAKGTVTIKTARRDSRVEITVTDTGHGISPMDMDQIFEPLFSTKSFGVGLGLPITKQIMEMEGGGITVDSELGKGTTVTLWLPVQPPAPGEPTAATETRPMQ